MATTDIKEFTGVTRRLEMRDVTLRGVPVIDAGDVDSFTYALTARDGTSLDSGSLAPDPDVSGTWFAEVAVPDRPGELVHVHWVATKGTSTRKWHGSIQVRAFS